MPEVIVLGSGTGIPTGRRASPGLLLRPGKGGLVLIDPGPGTLCRLTAAGFSIAEVDRVLITHHHPDHTLDIMALLFARKNPSLKSCPRLALIGPRGTKDLYARMLGLYGRWLEPPEGDFMIHEVSEGRLPTGMGLPGFAYATEHQEGSLGYRLELPSGTLAISGDSERCRGLVELGKGADLYFLECSKPDAPEPIRGHLTPAMAGAIAAEAAPRTLVLYHLYSEVDRDQALAIVKQYYVGTLSVAEDGERFVF